MTDCKPANEVNEKSPDRRGPIRAAGIRGLNEKAPRGVYRAGLRNDNALMMGDCTLLQLRRT